jgi:hypothetical protein
MEVWIFSGMKALLHKSVVTNQRSLRENTPGILGITVFQQGLCSTIQ